MWLYVHSQPHHHGLTSFLCQRQATNSRNYINLIPTLMLLTISTAMPHEPHKWCVLEIIQERKCSPYGMVFHFLPSFLFDFVFCKVRILGISYLLTTRKNFCVLLSIDMYFSRIIARTFTREKPRRETKTNLQWRCESRKRKHQRFGGFSLYKRK